MAGFLEGGVDAHRRAIREAPKEELIELILEYLGIPEGLDSVADPRARQTYEGQIADLLEGPRHLLAMILAPGDALY